MPKQEVKCLLHGQCQQVQSAVPEFLFLARPQFPVIKQTVQYYAFVLEMGANACPHCRAIGGFFQSPSLMGCFALLSGCGGELSGPSGSFQSPGYPNRYPSNRECIWYIHTAPGSSIQLTIQEFDIEYHPNCNYDVLEVRALDLLLKNTQVTCFSVWNR